MPICKDFLTIFRFSNGKEIVNRFFEQSDEDIKYLSNLYNGIKNIYSSVNPYEIVDGNRKAIIQQSFFDFDEDPEATKKFVLYLLNKDIRFSLYFSGNGHHVYIPCKGNGDSKNLRILQYSLLHDSETTCDLHVVGDAFRVSRIPNTFNLSANKFCIPIKIEEIGIEDADKQRFKSFQYGTKILDLSSFIEDNYTYIKEDVIKNVKINSDVILLPCVRSIINSVNPKHYQRYVLVCYLSDVYRNGVSLRNFNVNEIVDKVFEFLKQNASHWIDWDPETTKYFLNNIIPKFDISCGCQFIQSKNCCIDCKRLK